MKQSVKYLFICFGIIILNVGCATTNKNTRENRMPGWVKLPQMVSESFSYHITDPQVRKVLMSIETKSLGPSNRLEIKLLQQLASIDNPDAMGNAFDQVWETEKSLREIFQQNDPPAAFIPSLALSYFMLTYDDTYDWRDQTAETLYNRTLQEIKPNRLSGYPLHYYILALLNNGNFDTAWLFLNQLKKITTPTIYLKDLNIALDYGMKNNDVHFITQIIHQMITHCRENDLILPEKNITVALEKLKTSGGLKPVAEGLCHYFDPETLKEYAFYQYIAPFEKIETQFQSQKLQQQTATSKPEKPETQKPFSKPAVIEKPLVTPKTPPKSEISKIKLREDAVHIRVQTISANNKANYVDPELGDMGVQLKESLQMSQVYLKNESAFLLIPGRQETLTIDNYHDVIVLLKTVSAGNACIDVTIRKGAEEIYNTVINSVDNGETIIGGPKIDDDSLILRITTWLKI